MGKTLRLIEQAGTFVHNTEDKWSRFFLKEKWGEHEKRVIELARWLVGRSPTNKRTQEELRLRTYCAWIDAKKPKRKKADPALVKEVTRLLDFLVQDSAATKALATVAKQATAVDKGKGNRAVTTIRCTMVSGESVVLSLSPPGAKSKYKKWPKSFQAIMAKCERVAVGDTYSTFELGESRGWDPGAFDEDELGMNPRDALVPIDFNQDWYLYGPDRICRGEPALQLCFHGGGFEKPETTRVGTVFLRLLADYLKDH